jgi:hypothetical protein
VNGIPWDQPGADPLGDLDVFLARARVATHEAWRTPLFVAPPPRTPDDDTEENEE